MPANDEEAEREGWRADAVRGRLCDLGPYPAQIDLDEPDADWVEDFVRPVSLHELEERHDPWEEFDQGVYRCEEMTTRSGCRAWVYVYQGPWPSSARGPVARWQGTRRDPILPDRDSSENRHNP